MTKQTPKLFHVQTDTSIKLPQTNTVIRIGKADCQFSPDIDISEFPNSGIVSRIHAGISQKGDTYFIEDLKSSNGTYLNNVFLVPQKPYHLKHEDRIDFGKSKDMSFLFQLEEVKDTFNKSDIGKIISFFIIGSLAIVLLVAVFVQRLRKSEVTEKITSSQQQTAIPSPTVSTPTPSFSSSPSQSVPSQPTATPEPDKTLSIPSPVPTFTGTYQIGQIVHLENINFTVFGVKLLGKNLTNSAGFNLTALGVWNVVVVDILNNSTSTINLNLTQFILRDSTGNIYKVAADATGAYSVIVGNPIHMTQPPSTSQRVYLVFDVTPSKEGFELAVVKPELGTNRTEAVVNLKNY